MASIGLIYYIHTCRIIPLSIFSFVWYAVVHSVKYKFRKLIKFETSDIKLKFFFFARINMSIISAFNKHIQSLVVYYYSIIKFDLFACLFVGCFWLFFGVFFLEGGGVSDYIMQCLIEILLM